MLPAVTVTALGVAATLKSGAGVPRVKLQTVAEPAEAKIPQLSRLVTVFCSVRNRKFEPTVCSAPPGAVTKIEYVCAGTLTA